MQTNKEALPRHIAIIMDGNGRWAKKRGQVRTMGHKAGVETLKKIVEECSNLGIEYLTAYAFSTENWKREAGEVSAIMTLIELYLKSEIEKMIKNGIRFETIGDLSRLPQGVQRIIESSKERTKNNRGTTLTIALNYGGRDDILRGVQKLAQQVQDGVLLPSDINEAVLHAQMDTHFLPDPDLVIRPSGELRLSNFLLWESAYSEFWFADICWPDFDAPALHRAIESYQARDRRFGNAR